MSLDEIDVAFREYATVGNTSAWSRFGNLLAWKRKPICVDAFLVFEATLEHIQNVFNAVSANRRSTYSIYGRR